MAVTGFEQLEVGQVFTSAPHPMDTAAIKAFATAFDPQAQHVDEAAARHTLFGELVASGWHTASVTMRLMLESALEGVSGRGMGVKINEISWAAPVKPGDSLYAVSEVLELRPSRSKPDRGVVVMRTLTRNQHDQTVQDMTGTLLILRSDAVL
jgi:acyl dehydratase